MRNLSKLPMAVLLLIVTSAWDTRVNEQIAWHSIYNERTDEPDYSQGPASNIPEHTTLSDMALSRLDETGQTLAMFGRGGTANHTLVDLNANHFRWESLFRVEPFGDDSETYVEERRIPPPAMFAGLPDYSYTIYDWLNKNRTCPPFSGSVYTEGCHVFMPGWLGALNSVHFGSQARQMYAHQHHNALAMARRARSMREAMTEEEREVYRDELLEAELLALSYEGYGQHYLQDRWAIGHMWERWGSPDPGQEQRPLIAHLAIGGLAGLIHGAENVVKDYSALEYVLMRADPMSSPLAGDGAARPMVFRRFNGTRDFGPRVPAIGDERLDDARDQVFRHGLYGASFSNNSLDVSLQMDQLLECSSAGWAEVIREFGEADGGYGAHGARLGVNAPDFPITERQDCWNVWATNESMMIGLLGPNPARSIAAITALSFVGPAPLTAAERGAVGVGSYAGNRAEFGSYAMRLWLQGRTNADSTTVARGALSTGLTGQDLNGLWGFQSGNNYSLPSYIEPLGLQGDPEDSPSLSQQTLRFHDARGRDVQTIYGAFSGAFSDYWCENRNFFRELRANPTERNRGVCEVVATRIYEGTHPRYNGIQRQQRTNAYDEPVRSLCRIRGTSGVESAESNDFDNPFYLDQGYVPHGDRAGLDSLLTEFTEIANWCGGIPTVYLSRDEDLRNDNVVQEIPPDREYLELTGAGFGTQPGEVRLTSEGHSEIVLGPDQMVSWEANRIEFNTRSVSWENDVDYEITVTPARENRTWPDIPSVGYFLLRVREPNSVEFEHVNVDLNNTGPCGEAVPTFELIDLSQGMTSNPSAEEIAEIAAEYAEDFGMVRDYLVEQRACMVELSRTGMPILAQAVDEIGTAASATSGQFWALSGPYGQPQSLINAYISESDNYYANHIASVDFVIEGLGRTLAVVEAWHLAFESDDPFLYPARAIYPLNQSDAETAAEVLDEYFFDALNPEDAIARGVFDNAEMAQSFQTMAATPELRSNLVNSRASYARTDFEFIGGESLSHVRSVVEGLAPWAQVQHTLTQFIIPGVDASMQYLDGVVASELESTLREMEEDGRLALMECEGQYDESCMIGVDVSGSADTIHEYYDWAAAIIGGPATRITAWQMASNSGGYDIAWPSERQRLAAANRGASIQTQGQIEN